MKKYIITSILVVIILITATITIHLSKKNKDENKDLQTIRLAEVTHSSFYTPLYVAKELGYLEEVGLDIELILTPGADKVSAAVLSNDVEIGFAGAESAIYVYNEQESDYLQIFAGLTKRDGQFIVAKEDIKDFTLQDLIGKEILVGRKSGMPALNFLNALKNQNIDLTKVNANFSVEFAALSGTFIGSDADFVNLFEPNATALEKEGYGHVVASIGELSGEVPYTAFYARKSYIEDRKSVV